MTIVTGLMHHVEVREHIRIIPLFIESERSAGETGDEDDSRLPGVTGGLCPDLGAIRRGNVDGKGRGSEGESSKERSKLHDDAGQ